MADSSFNKFSVPLGLLDYVNPVFYTVTMVTIVRNTYDSMGLPYNVILLAGAVFSIIFGLIIPTGKVLVGLGVIKFRMPVSLVFCVNSGILVSGLMLLRFVLGLLFLMLCGIGIKADLKNPKIHWTLEASNGMCQMLVALGTLILFAG